MAIETINSKVNLIRNVMLSIVSFHSSEGGRGGGGGGGGSNENCFGSVKFNKSLLPSGHGLKVA